MMPNFQLGKIPTFFLQIRYFNIHIYFLTIINRQFYFHEFPSSKFFIRENYPTSRWVKWVELVIPVG
jgi:hypothetical protein